MTVSSLLVLLVLVLSLLVLLLLVLLVLVLLLLVLLRTGLSPDMLVRADIQSQAGMSVLALLADTLVSAFPVPHICSSTCNSYSR